MSCHFPLVQAAAEAAWIKGLARGARPVGADMEIGIVLLRLSSPVIKQGFRLLSRDTMLSLIAFLSPYLLSTYSVPGTVLGTVVTAGEHMLSFMASWTPHPRFPRAFPWTPLCKIDLDTDLFAASI